MKKNNHIKILVILLSIFPLMLNKCLLQEPRSIIEIRDSGVGTMERPHVFSLANKIAGGTRDPISIIGDAAFTPTNGVSEGTGTAQDPYIIANWIINGNDDFCIRITDTTKHFIIENCTLIGSPASILLTLYNVINGHLRNNTCNTSNIGIRIGTSDSNTLTKNTCSGNTIGILIISSSSNTLTNNTCSGNTIGIRLIESSSNNTLTNNTCHSNSQYGIWLETSSSQNNLTNNACSDNDYGIYVVSSSSNTLTNNNCSSNYFGIYLSDSSSNNTLTMNIITDNVGPGINISSSVDNLVHWNWIWDNGGNIRGNLSENDIFENFFFSLEVNDVDHDGLPDGQEIALGTNLFLVDTDGDNFMDGYEYACGSDPLDSSDYPLLWQEDFDKLIAWADGNATLLETVYALASGNVLYLQTLNASCITQFEEMVALIEQLGISVGDTDYDGLSDLEELSYGTSIVLMDTDCDNLNDAFEIKIGTDPLDEDSDGDGFLDGIEVLSGTNPKDALDFPTLTEEPTLLDLGPVLGLSVIVLSLTTLAGGGFFFYLRKKGLSLREFLGRSPPETLGD